MRQRPRGGILFKRATPALEQLVQNGGGRYRLLSTDLTARGTLPKSPQALASPCVTGHRSATPQSGNPTWSGQAPPQV